MTEQQLLIFTRYPEAGKTKTRLIPALGPQGAAQLQRYLTEHTLAIVQLSQELADFQLKIYYSGANHQSMKDWLGDYPYYCQQGEDLGARLKQALNQVMSNRDTRVIIIGIDCLDLTPDLIHQAFQMLTTHDLVLGPAKDGGYYLIGLKHLSPELFTHIPWGTDQVLASTLEIANQLNLKTYLLPLLSDLDLPEDLSPQLWSRFSRQD